MCYLWGDLWYRYFCYRVPINLPPETHPLFIVLSWNVRGNTLNLLPFPFYIIFLSSSVCEIKCIVIGNVIICNEFTIASVRAHVRKYTLWVLKMFFFKYYFSSSYIYIRYDSYLYPTYILSSLWDVWNII